jgi:catechol 2,3-dioxygenase-like lactoylglutathione lyase family enzyme
MAMNIERIDHYNIATSLIEETREFYEKALGMHVGPRPNFPTGGYWMYFGDYPWVHLSTIDEGLAPPRTILNGQGNGLDHISFRLTGLKDLLRRLDENGIEFEQREGSDAPIVQLFITDPNGIVVELLLDAKAEGVKDPKARIAAPA